MSFWGKLLGKLKRQRLLCDTCAFDYPSACNNPARPNAKKCPDYRRRY